MDFTQLHPMLILARMESSVNRHSVVLPLMYSTFHGILSYIPSYRKECRLMRWIMGFRFLAKGNP